MYKTEPTKLEPFWTVADDETKFYDWWGTFCDKIKNDVQTRFTEDRRKRDFYEGYQSLQSMHEKIPRDRETLKRQHGTKITVNRAQEVVSALATQILRNASSVEVYPANSQEHSDRINAKLSKSFFEHLSYVNDIKRLQYEYTMDCKIYGNGCVIVDYDHYAGDIRPGQQPDPEASLQPIVDPETGEAVFDDEGKPLVAQQVERTGDVAWRVRPRRFVVLEPGVESKHEASYFIEIDCEHKRNLAAKYPQHAEKILGRAYYYSSKGAIEDILSSEHKELGDDWVWTYKLYHKGTEFLDAGRFVHFTSDCLLENTSLVQAVGHRMLPLVWVSDWDIPDTPYAKSVLDKIGMLQIVRNNLVSIMYTNLALASHIYWIIHNTSKVKIGHIRNAPSVINYAGSVAPRIEQFRSVGGELLTAIELVDRMIDRIAALHEINFGQVPKRMDSGAGIAELDELQARQMHTPLRKHDRSIEDLARLSLATAGYFYQEDDDRTIRVVGKNNKVSIKSLSGAKLGGAYDIRVQRASGLADSKSGRIAQLKELAQAFPGLMPNEQVLDLLNLGNVSQYYTYGTAAVELAQQENERMAEGGVAGEPMQHEEHAVHWFEHAKYMQSASFKEDMPPQIQQLFKLHLSGHEYFILNIIKVNPVFAQTFLQENPMFPLVMPPETLVSALPAQTTEE
jgi:hypothetical protein